ncbi:hypothetical protein Tco_0323815 [Tanacetum coccineum]
MASLFIGNLTECGRQLQRSWQRSWVAVIEIMPIDQASNLVEGLGSEEKGPPKLGEGSSELNKGQRRKLHPLGEYVINLYTNGKLHTRVTVTLISGSEGTSLSPPV